MHARVLGVEEVRRALARLPEEVRTRAVRTALRRGGEVIADRFRELAPRGATRVLGRRLVLRGRKREGLPTLTVATDPAAWYAHFVEFGTKPHALGRGSNLESRGRRGRQRGPGHPGSPRQEPFTRSIEQTKGEVVRAVRDALARSRALRRAAG